MQNQQKVQREKHYKYMNEQLDKQQQKESDRFARQMQREVDAMRSGCEVGCRRPQIDYFPNSNRTSGNINFNIGFGKGRNRGNININKGW